MRPNFPAADAGPFGSDNKCPLPTRSWARDGWIYAGSLKRSPHIDLPVLEESDFLKRHTAVAGVRLNGAQTTETWVLPSLGVSPAQLHNLDAGQVPVGNW